MRIGNLEVYGIIYKITNKINNKCYIGQTTNKYGFKGRYRQSGDSSIERVYKYHIHERERGKSFNDHLLKSIEKYGFEAFEVIEVLDVAFSKEELNTKEIMYINIFNSLKNGYNMTSGGEGTRKYTSYNATKVVAFGDGFEFRFVSKSKGAEYFGIKNNVDVCSCCHKKLSYAGKYNGKRIIWREAEEYDKMTKEEKQDCINQSLSTKRNNNGKNKSIKIIYNNKDYDFCSITNACRWMLEMNLVSNVNMAKAGIDKCLKGEIISYKNCIIKYLNN